MEVLSTGNVNVTTPGHEESPWCSDSFAHFWQRVSASFLPHPEFLHSVLSSFSHVYSYSLIPSIIHSQCIQLRKSQGIGETAVLSIKKRKHLHLSHAAALHLYVYNKRETEVSRSNTVHEVRGITLAVLIIPHISRFFLPPRLCRMLYIDLLKNAVLRKEGVPLPPYFVTDRSCS